ncbi:hypothetical protein KQ247_07630 [Ruegeria pomeroyi]|uniref:Uncharacterized protein n=1 Tax=Ruegeria pomeroyi TaxID=89184 RepID=A0A850LIH6_9RHOB|nr:hypothetical protein [Ruegeria pomeroyi]NVK97904.1 hypothetical protein [Ruegeria pomeroyi]QWV11102.1 hypothetical protein KQ247_07630 [Ruegeria pomeroyi]
MTLLFAEPGLIGQHEEPTMQIDRSKPETPHLHALSGQISTLQGPCVGCSDCVGLCKALIDTLVVPDLVLTRKRETS